MTRVTRAWFAITFSMIVSSLILASLGCNNSDSYGAGISEQTVTRIENIAANAADYYGKTVRVEGRIIDECPGGHWFHLKGEKDVVYVTLSGFTLPQKVGKTAVVEGSVMNDERLTILGKGVEVK